jgi:hypothetical protein
MLDQTNLASTIKPLLRVWIRWQTKFSLRPGINVGFTLDPFPDFSKPYNLSPTAGPLLAQTKSFLAIQAFISEIALGTADIRVLIPKKQDFINGWLATRIPVILDVSAGYDAHIVFPTKDDHLFRYGNNEIWRNGQT